MDGMEYHGKKCMPLFVFWPVDFFRYMMTMIKHEYNTPRWEGNEKSNIFQVSSRAYCRCC